MGEKTMNSTIAGILGIVAFVVVGVAVQHFMGKARNKVDRAVRAEKYAKEEDLLSTVVTFNTSASIQALRRSIMGHVTLRQGGFIKNGMQVLHDSDQGIAWEFGSVDSGGGFRAALYFDDNGGTVTGTYSITKHMMVEKRVSPYINEMMQLRNEVIDAFKHADSYVRISTGNQVLERSEKFSFL